MAEATVEFPVPHDTGLAAHYWQRLREGALEFQRCTHCNNAWLPARSECPKCLGPDWRWEKASGRARLVSWVVYHHGYHPWFAARLPYNVAVVELAEGARLLSNIVESQRGLKIDMPLQLVIEHEGSVALPRFKPA